MFNLHQSFKFISKVALIEKYLPYLISVSVYLIFHQFLTASLPISSSIYFVASSNHDVELQLYYWNGIDNRHYQEDKSVRSNTLHAGKISNCQINSSGFPVHRTFIAFGEAAGTIKLYKITVFSPFTSPVVLDAERIADIFIPVNDETTLTLHREYVEISSTATQPSIISTKPLLPSPIFLSFLLPALFAVGSFLLSSKIHFPSLPPLRSVTGKQPLSRNNIDALDGLRGLAAVMVIGDHCVGSLLGLGAFGVWIFMALSGFLLVRPFVSSPQKIVEKATLTRFFSRRVKRILPAYYTYITIVYLFGGYMDEAFRHYSFLEGAGHLWVIPQEIVFYILSPLILAINWLLIGGRSLRIACFLGLLIFLANTMLTVEVFSLYGMNFQNLRLYVGVFLSGAFFSYLYYGVLQIDELREANRIKITRTICGIIGFVLILGLGFLSVQNTPGTNIVYSQFHFGWFGIGAGLLVFCAAAAEKTLLEKFLSWVPLRAIGVVGLSIYLFHPIVFQLNMEIAAQYWGITLTSWPLYITTLVGSYMLACISYTCVEFPFLRQR